MTFNEWPPQEKPRERWLHYGPQALSDAEIVALILNTGGAKQNVCDLARTLLARTSSLEAFAQLSWQSLAQFPGMGQIKALRILAALEFGRRCQRSAMQSGQPLLSTKATAHLFQTRLAQSQQEIFACLFLDNNLRFIHYQELFKGTINHLHIYIREILKHALHYNAAHMVIAHNHPKGPAYPSGADIAVTEQLFSLLHQIDVTLIDHIVIGDIGYYSFAEHKKIPSYQPNQ